MPPKRKAPAADGRSSKRVASGMNTPVSVRDSDDDFDESTEMDESEREADHKFDGMVKKFQVSTYSKKAVVPTADPASRLFKQNHDFFDEPLKPDHSLRPLWIDRENGRVVLETFSPSFKRAQNFLINIAEPVSRTTNMHEYTISPHSLFAAVSVGLTKEDIIKDLELFSKTKVPENIKQFVHQVTESFGKVRLVLKHNKYFIESNDAKVLQMLLRDEVISQCRVQQDSDEIVTEKAAKKGGLVIPGTKEAVGVKEAVAQAQQESRRDQEEEDSDDEFGGREAEKDMEEFLREEEDDDEVDQVHSFEIYGEKIQQVQEHCNVKLNLPLTEEYDFRADDVNANLDIDLRPSVQIRYYQEHALSKMFG